MMAAGPAIDEASHAPNNQPEPIREPSPSKTSCERLILLLFDLLFFHNYSFYMLKNSTNYYATIIR